MFNNKFFSKMTTVDFKNSAIGAYPCGRPRANFSIRVFMMALVISLAVVSCDKDDDKDDGDDGNSEVSNTVTDAFKQFGADVEQVKPKVATPDEATNKSRCAVSSSVYTARAYYREKSSATISNEVAVAYKERMFNYIKSISADKKCYRLRLSVNEVPEEVAAFSDLLNFTGAHDDWSYKFNGMWVNAMTLYASNNEIGIDLLGMATY